LRHQASAHCASGAPGGSSLFFDLFHFQEHFSDLLGRESGPDIIGREGGVRVIFPGQEPTGQRHPREDAQIVPPRVRKDQIFRFAIQTIIDHLEHLRSDRPGLTRLQIVIHLAGDRDPQVADLPRLFLLG